MIRKKLRHPGGGTAVSRELRCVDPRTQGDKVGVFEVNERTLLSLLLLMLFL